jgi:hypothetical protein
MAVIDYISNKMSKYAGHKLMENIFNLFLQIYMIQKKYLENWGEGHNTSFEERGSK